MAENVIAWTGDKPKRAPLRAAEDVHRLPPQSLEGEMGVLASILAGAEYRPQESAEAMLEAQEKIGPGHFYIPANRVIWEMLVWMFEQKKPLNTLALTQELRDRNLLDSVGGAGYVTQIGTYVPTAADISYYLDVLRDKFILREIIAVCAEAGRRAYEEQDEVNELLDDVQKKITDIAMDRSGDSPLRKIGEDVFQVVRDVEKAQKHKGRTTGLATGFLDLDRMTNGLHPGELNVIAARTSMGKTAFAMNIVQYVAMPRVSGPKWQPDKWKYPGYPVAVFSLETSSYRLVRRMVASEARVSLKKMKDGFLNEGKTDAALAELPKIQAAGIKLEPVPIYIDHTPSLRIFDFKARARFAVVRLGVKLIVIDYVQLMSAGGKRAAENAYERSIELTRISAALKTAARELNVPIIAIAQLNREAEKNASGKPRMSNLRECGAFEQDADFVGLLWRKDYYEEEKEREVAAEAELIVAKQKDGPTNTIKLVFFKEYTRFENRAGLTDMYSNDPQDYQEGYLEE